MEGFEGAGFIRHAPCPDCGSSDALAIYTNNTYCFSCRTYTPLANDDLHPRLYHREAVKIDYTGEHRPIKNRKITEEVVRKFNVKTEGNVLKFPYTDANGNVVGFKGKSPDKQFWYEGAQTDTLFGQHLWRSGGSILTITEGEMDALAVAEAKPGWPVVSIPHGASAAKKDLSKQLDWLLRFDEIHLMFDNDEAGIQAAEECAQLFPYEKLKLCSLQGYKDASEALMAGDRSAIRFAGLNAKHYTPSSIVDGRDLYSIVTEPLHTRDASWCLECLDTALNGLRLKELVTLTGGTGTGKSTLCGEAATSLIQQGFTVGYVPLEEGMKRAGRRLMTPIANIPLHKTDAPREVKDKAFRETLGTGRLFLRNGFGSFDIDVILNDLRYLVKAKECQWLFLDHISMLVSGSEGDERKLIDVSMTKLRSFVEETGVGLILVSHLRKLQGDKGHEEGQAISLSHLRGSQAIAQLSDVVIAGERNIYDGSNKVHYRVLKDRQGGSTGPAGYAHYDKATGRLTDCEPETPAEDNDDF